MRFSSVVSIMVVITTFYFTFNYLSVYEHESAHQEIFKMYDINSTVDIFPNQYYMGVSGMTIVDPNQSVPLIYKDDLNNLQAMNEIIGYNMATLGTAVLFGFIIVSFAILLHANHPKAHYNIDRGVENN